MSPIPRRRLARSAVVAVSLVVQLLVLYMPDAPDAPGGVEIPGADKAAHLLVFAAVSYAALRAGVPRTLVVGYGLGQALLSELVQHLWLPLRTGDPLDLLADLAGVALALTLTRALARRYPRTGRRAGAGTASSLTGRRSRTGRDPSDPNR
ncbi:hypothetical protein GCM10023169_11830 [Georgenia halophila]|uniref:VanZ family protein n=1 Tax=Georgenia halophila TaxID=620889 RepID=A0ABP8L0M4_9MICO